jgi:BMFP domain-containing protein YqiC
MLDFRKIDGLADELRRLLPAGTQVVQDELRESVRIAVEAMLSRLDLVTREEFDAQSALLGRTRAKLDELEKVIAALERDETAPHKDG